MISQRKKLEEKLFKKWARIIHLRNSCELCGSKSGPLDAHHIKGRVGSLYFSLDNGILLCVDCHRLGCHDTSSTKQEIFKEKLINYIGIERYERLNNARYSYNKLSILELEELDKQYSEIISSCIV